MRFHFKPELYQKRFPQQNYFEGWYYKLVSSNQRYVISFIPGVSFSKNKKHCFIQCIFLDHKDLSTYNVNYNIEDFKSSNTPFGVKISESSFSLSTINVNINEDNLCIKGEVHIDKILQIKKSLLTPNIMGFFSYLPFMECNHGVISMRHDLKGTIVINEKEVCFDHGIGYIEKDFGVSFPSQYVWIQSNHFSQDVNLFFSLAKIPYLGLNFDGFICNLIYQGNEYRFATYNLSNIVIDFVSHDKIKVTMKRKKLRLVIEAEILDSKPLLAPSDGEMVDIIKEALAGKVKLSLYRRDELVLSDQSECCGIEIVNY